MSCHDIGRGLNTVSKEIIDLYNKGKITIKVAKTLLKTAKVAVNYCDGNEFEAIACLFENDICSACLDECCELYDLSDVIDYNSKTYEKIENNPYYVSSVMCEECAKKFLVKQLGAEEAEKKLEELLENAYIY